MLASKLVMRFARSAVNHRVDNLGQKILCRVSCLTTQESRKLRSVAQQMLEVLIVFYYEVWIHGLDIRNVDADHFP